MKVLSLFDGMACGMIAMQLAGVEVDSYDAYEIDKYAIKTAQHNFPMIEEHGDVFAEDFTKYAGKIDFLIGGSPCTYWSIAQTKNRETVASGIGWELFSQYVRALHEAKPKYFIYENNKSMSKQIRASIDDAFGFEAVFINSALVSAQNRQRLYWVGKRNDDGTYSKVNVEQPEDRGILLKDVLDTSMMLSTEPINEAVGGKSYCVTSRYYKGFGDNPGRCLEKHRDSMVAEHIALSEREMDYMVRDHQDRRWTFCSMPAEKEKSPCITANIHNGVPYNVVEEPVNTTLYATPITGTMDYPIYHVKDGYITIKGKEYPIKLRDGYYIIRKLTVSECKRLQTVPELYDFSCVSNSQAYKMLGNGWTCEVIAHILKCFKEA